LAKVEGAIAAAPAPATAAPPAPAATAGADPVLSVDAGACGAVYTLFMFPAASSISAKDPQPQAKEKGLTPLLGLVFTDLPFYPSAKLVLIAKFDLTHLHQQHI
jgi:hypothetical protein